MAEVGLVSARADSYYNVYKLEEETLQKTRLMFSQEDLASVIEDVDLNAYDRKVVADFSLPDGRLRSIPSQRKKLEAILRYVVKAFELNVLYSEKQVNEILSRYHDDVATLRRELIGYRLLDKEDGGEAYWRVESK